MWTWLHFDFRRFFPISFCLFIYGFLMNETSKKMNGNVRVKAVWRESEREEETKQIAKSPQS